MGTYTMELTRAESDFIHHAINVNLKTLQMPYMVGAEGDTNSQTRRLDELLELSNRFWVNEEGTKFKFTFNELSIIETQVKLYMEHLQKHSANGVAPIPAYRLANQIRNKMMALEINYWKMPNWAILGILGIVLIYVLLFMTGCGGGGSESEDEPVYNQQVCNNSNPKTCAF